MGGGMEADVGFPTVYKLLMGHIKYSYFILKRGLKREGFQNCMYLESISNVYFHTIMMLFILLIDWDESFR